MARYRSKRRKSYGRRRKSSTFSRQKKRNRRLNAYRQARGGIRL